MRYAPPPCSTCQSKLVNLTVQVNRQGPVISNDELIAIRNRLEDLRLKAKEINEARKAGDLEKVASLSKHYQPILEEGFKQSFEDIKKYVKDGPGLGEVLAEAWWGFQLKFLSTFDWICDNPFKAAGLLALTIVAPEVMLGVMVGSMAVETGKGIGALTYGYMNNDWAHIQHGAQTLGGVGFDAATLAGPHFLVKGYGAFRNIPAVKVQLARGPKLELPNVFVRPKTEPTKVEPPKVEPPKVEPPKTEPLKTEPGKVDPKVEGPKEPAGIPPESSLPRTPEAQKANGGVGSDTLNLSPWYWKSFGELFHVAVALKVLPWMKVYLDGLPAGVRNTKIAELKPQVEANAVELKALEGKAADATKANKPLEAGDQARLDVLKNQKEALAELNRGLITENFLREAGLGDRITLDKPATSMRVGEATDVLSLAYKENPALTRQVVKDWTGDGKLSEPVTKWLENAFNDAGIKPGEKVVIIWNRQQAYAADRSTSAETLIALMDAAKANGRRVVLMGDKLPPEVAAHVAKQPLAERAADLTEAWKTNPELGQYQPQLKLAKHLLDNFDAAQIGMKSGGLDGAAFMGMKTSEIVSSRGAVEVSNGSSEVPVKLGNGKEFEVDLAALDRVVAGKPKGDHFNLTTEWLKAEYARQSKEAGVAEVPEMVGLMAKYAPRMSNTRMIQLEEGLPFRIVERADISPKNANATMRDLFSLMPKGAPKGGRPAVFPVPPSVVAPTKQDPAQKSPPPLRAPMCDPPPVAPPTPH